MAFPSSRQGGFSDAQKAAKEIAKSHRKSGRRAGKDARKTAKNISHNVSDLLRKINKDTSSTLDQVFKGVDRTVSRFAGH